MDHTFGVVPKRSSPYPRSSRFSLMLFSKSFTVLHFTFRSVIHYEFIFAKGVRSASRVIICMCIASCSSTICWNDHLSPLCCLYSFIKDQLTICMWSVSRLPILFQWSIYLFSHQHHTVLFFYSFPKNFMYFKKAGIIRGSNQVFWVILKFSPPENRTRFENSLKQENLQQTLRRAMLLSWTVLAGGLASPHTAPRLGVARGRS